MRKNDWHWLAGIWEGEGTVCMCATKERSGARGIRIVVTVSQKDTTMLDEVRRITGIGSIHPGHGAHIWLIASRNAREFIIRLLPFVRTERRRMQIQKVLELDTQARLKGKASLIAANKRRRLANGRFGH